MAEEKKFNVEQKAIVQVINAPKVLSWTGVEFDIWLQEIEDWTKENIEPDSKKYSLLIE